MTAPNSIYRFIFHFVCEHFSLFLFDYIQIHYPIWILVTLHYDESIF